MMKKKLFIFLLACLVVSPVIYIYQLPIKDWIARSFLTAVYVKWFRDGPSIDADHLITTLDNGMKIIVNKHDRCVCWWVRFSGHWDSNETKVLRKLIRKEMKIIEVGGNFGVHTLGMAELVGEKGHIYSFEANPHVSKYLKQSVTLSKLEDRISIFEMALAKDPYEGFMVYGTSNIGGGYILPHSPETSEKCKNQECIPIHVKKLDDILKQESINPEEISLLKMDAEGAEFWILEGAASLLSNPNLMLMIEHDINHLKRNRIQPMHLLELLKASGFTHVYSVKKGGSLEERKWDDLLSQNVFDLVITKEEFKL